MAKEPDERKYRLLKGLVYVDPEIRASLFVGQGRFMNGRDIRRLFNRIADDPDDTDARWILAGVRELAIPKSDEQLEQLVANLIWLVKHYPESKGHQEVMLGYAHPLYEKLKRAWKVELRKHQEDADVAINAGHAFLIIDKAFAERCYKKATEICPTDADLWQRLSHAYSLHAGAGSEGTAGKRYARKSVQALLTAMKSQGSRKDGYVGQCRHMLLVDAAKMALAHDVLDEAILLGELLIEAARLRERKSDRPKAIRQHDARDIGNAVLGVVAIKRNQIDGAVRYLDRIDGAVRSEELVLLLANSLIRKREYAAVSCTPRRGRRSIS